MEIHDIDIDNLDIYDLIINTDTFNIESTVNIIKKCIENKK